MTLNIRISTPKKKEKEKKKRKKTKPLLHPKFFVKLFVNFVVCAVGEGTIGTSE